MLVAIAIPIFTTQLEKAREATDAANIRSAYAEVAATVLSDNPTTDLTTTVTKKQTQANWQNAASIADIAGVAIANINSNTATTITYEVSSGKIKIDGHEVPSTTITSP